MSSVSRYRPPPAPAVITTSAAKTVVKKPKSWWLQVSQTHLFQQVPLPTWSFYLFWFILLLFALYGLAIYYEQHHALDTWIRTAKQQQDLALTQSYLRNSATAPQR